MKKLLLAAVLAVLALKIAHAVCDSRTTSCFTAVDVSGALTTGSLSNAGATTLTGTLTAGTIAVSTITISGSQGLRLGTVAATTSTPAAAGILIRNSSNELYISTGTGAAAWVKVGGQ